MHTGVCVDAVLAIRPYRPGSGMSDRARVMGVALIAVAGGCLLMLHSLGSWVGLGLPAEVAAASFSQIQPVLVPTLGQWGLLLLALTMMGVAFWVIRRNSDSKGRR